MDPADTRRILEEERARGLDLIARAASLEDLEAAKVSVLGRKAAFSEVQRALGSFADAERRALGTSANEVRLSLGTALEERRVELEELVEAGLLSADGVDVTLPGRRPRPGSLHPLTIVERQMVEVFTRMGYRVAE